MELTMQCIKTGCSAYLEEYGEHIYGDAFQTAGGALVVRCCYRGRENELGNRRHFTIRRIAHWFDDDKTGMAQNSTMIVEPAGYVDHGYEGINEDELTAAESLR
jgi:hypothetical protein